MSHQVQHMRDSLWVRQSDYRSRLSATPISASSSPPPRMIIFLPPLRPLIASPGWRRAKKLECISKSSRRNLIQSGMQSHLALFTVGASIYVCVCVCVCVSSPPACIDLGITWCVQHIDTIKDMMSWIFLADDGDLGLLPTQIGSVGSTMLWTS